MSMLLLAIDTSGPAGSVSLAQCTPDGSCQQVELVAIAGGTFSAQLVPRIATLLENHGFSKNDIGAFAAASGPGSFTGLRVGLAAIKGLAEVLDKPIATVSLLEAVAVSGNLTGKVAAVLDARRDEVFVGEYLVSSLGAELIREQLLTITEWLDSAPDWPVVTPDAPIANAARARGIRVEQIERPRSDVIARLGCRKTLEGLTVSTEDLDANYIRLSDAEIFSKREQRR